MTNDPDLASLAALITEPARAAMLAHLLDGRGWTATELGRAANVGASTASAHLRKLVDGRLIRVTPSGRHRYFRLADGEVARMLEHFAYFSTPRRPRTPGETRASGALRRCRLCYDHVAGEIGVALAQAMVRNGWIVDAEPWFRVTPAGASALAALGIAAADGRACVDWSERRPHVAGALGAEIARAALTSDWVRREKASRALWVTPAGEEILRVAFGVERGRDAS